ncbi:MAG: sulfite exporter TauE/SafE family protein [Alphaproteobacteria bacterium]|nr:sulfite exporter TauE/SafE family protein [Alphaproteobacteria bacterium]
MTLLLTLFLTGAGFAGFVSGLVGFAFALVAAPLWLRVLQPVEVTALVVSYGVLTQGYALWNMRREIDLRPSLPFIAGGLVGVPLGVWIARGIDPHLFQVVVGIFMMAYTAFLLLRPDVGRIHGGGRPADAAIGFVSGVLGGMTGFSGPIVTLWCALRPWNKYEQRQAYQPYLMVMHAATIASLWVAGSLEMRLGELFALGVPLVVLGLWAGFRLYRRVSDESYRRIVLWLLFASGFSLLW